MEIIQLNEGTFAAGRTAFSAYSKAQICGNLSEAYDDGMRRETGRRVLIGAIAECIEQGLDTEDEIVNAVARFSRCRRYSVESALDQLTGADPDLHIWGCRDGRYFDLRQDLGMSGPRPRIILV